MKISENKYNKLMMGTAVTWSAASYCKRRKVGAVISKDNRIISIGYNGTLSGVENKCEEKKITCKNCGAVYDVDRILHDIKDDDADDIIFNCICGITHHYTKDYLETVEPITSDLTIHAEQNALMFCTKNGIATDGCSIYITTSPCKTCAKLIAASGIKEVFYLEEYKDISGIEFLNRVNIPVKQIIL